MNKLILLFLLLLSPVLVNAAGGSALMFHADVDLGDKASLQRGAAVFANYCQGCHAASMMRFSHVARDLELSEDIVVSNLNFTGDKIGDQMLTAMDAADASDWFGTTPPDLSVIARARGADWLASYLQTFYLDPSRPTGVNNLTFKDVGMPHVMWDLQGWQRAVFSDDGKHIVGLELARPGNMNEEQYQQTVNDLVSYLVYVGEPAKLKRYHVGTWVILFLIIFIFFSVKLKKEYWRDVQ